LREFDAADLIETGPSGYLIRLHPGQLDSHRSNSSPPRRPSCATRPVGRGHRGRAAGTGPLAWPGPGRHGQPTIATRATRLDEDRLVALESCADWGLRLGRGRELISELAERVAAHPLRERSRAQLMLALHRSGRQPRRWRSTALVGVT